MEIKNSFLLSDTNLQGYYRLESNLKDSSTKGRTLTAVNTLTYIDYKYGKGYSQNNNKANYLKINNNMRITGGVMSMGCWFTDVATESSAGDRGILCQADATTSKTRFGICRTNGYLRFSRDGFGGGGISGAINLDWDTYIDTTKKTFLVLTYDGTNIRAYVDGVLRGTTPASGNGNGYSGSVTGFFVGMFEGWTGEDTTYNANGIYDEPFILNKTLSAEEIQTIFADYSTNYLKQYRRTRIPGSITGL